MQKRLRLSRCGSSGSNRLEYSPLPAGAGEKVRVLPSFFFFGQRPQVFEPAGVQHWTGLPLTSEIGKPDVVKIALWGTARPIRAPGQGMRALRGGRRLYAADVSVLILPLAAARRK